MVLFYVYYTQPDDCTEHKVFISLNFIFCIIVSIVSVLPKVQVVLSLLTSVFHERIKNTTILYANPQGVILL